MDSNKTPPVSPGPDSHGPRIFTPPAGSVDCTHMSSVLRRLYGFDRRRRSRARPDMPAQAGEGCYRLASRLFAVGEHAAGHAEPPQRRDAQIGQPGVSKRIHLSLEVNRQPKLRDRLEARNERRIVEHRLHRRTVEYDATINRRDEVHSGIPDATEASIAGEAGIEHVCRVARRMDTVNHVSRGPAVPRDKAGERRKRLGDRARRSAPPSPPLRQPCAAPATSSLAAAVRLGQ